jgi:PAS domain S-box-containing protein
MKRGSGRILLGLLLPFLATGVQWLLWGTIRPYVWFLFFPTVFLSSWLGGVRVGLASTITSALLGLFVFVPPELSLKAPEPNTAWAIAAFLAMGVIFSLTHAKLRAAYAQTADALAEAKRANETITGLYRRTKELDELKTQFFANVSHELRTPLSLILGPLSRQLSAPDLPESCARDLAMVDRNARLLERHVDDLLEVARLQSGKAELQISRTDLSRLVDSLTSYFSDVASEKAISIVNQIPDGITADVDALKFQRILINVLSNSLKFTPPGGRISVSLSEREETVELAVDDSGPGIPPEMRTMVFEPFRQLDGGKARHFGGTGLGLSIVHDLVELHRGRVSFHDSLLGGARCVVCLPRPAESALPPEQATGAIAEIPIRQAVNELRRAAPAAAPARRHTRRLPLVLIVEDDPDMSTFLCDTLSQRYDVMTASDGNDGMARARAEHPDLILTDLMMPQSDGVALVKSLRNDTAFDQVPIIVLTAVADNEIAMSLLEAGVQDYLRKPFRTREVVAKVDSHLQNRTRVLQQLGDREAMFSSLYDNMLNGFAHCRMIYEGDEPVDFVYLKVNSTFEKLTGLSNVTDKRVSEVIPGIRQSNPALFVQYARVARTGVPAEFEEFVPGLSMWFHVSVYRPRDGEFIAVFDVITERKQAELRLRELNERMQAILDNIPALVYVKDLEGHIILCNSRFDALFPIPHDEIIGRTSHELIPREVADAHRATDLEVVAGRSAVIREELNRQTDGEHVYLTTKFPLVRANGEVYGLCGVSTDITSRKKEEENRRKLEDELVRSQRLHSIGTLASGIAHDFNNILGIIMANASLLEAPPGNAEFFKQRLAAIETATDRAAHLVRQLLTIGRKSEIQRRLVNLNEMVEEIARLTRETFPGTIRIHTRLCCDLPQVSADPNQLNQVLLNLCLNARDAMPGGGDLSIETYEGEDPAASEGPSSTDRTDFVTIRVTDTGVGMDQQVLKQIFDPFFTTKKSGQGTGLGLAVAFSIVEGHGGLMKVSSTPGVGTEFVVRLPTGPGSDSLPDDPDIRLEEVSGGNETILLIEDEEDIRIATAEILERKGYAVIRTANGEQGESAFRMAHDRIALVLSDRGLPGEYGEDVFARLREIDPAVRFIMLTGFIPPEKRSEFLARGILTIVNKPCRPAALLSILREHLDRTPNPPDSQRIAATGTDFPATG